MKKTTCFILSFSLLISIIHSPLTVKAADEKNNSDLPFSIADTDYGINDDRVSAKKITITDDDVYEVGTYSEDMHGIFLLGKDLNNGKTRIYVVNYNGLVCTLDVSGFEKFERLYYHSNIPLQNWYKTLPERPDKEPLFLRYLDNTEYTVPYENLYVLTTKDNQYLINTKSGEWQKFDSVRGYNGLYIEAHIDSHPFVLNSDGKIMISSPYDTTAISYSCDGTIAYLYEHFYERSLSWTDGEKSFTLENAILPSDYYTFDGNIFCCEISPEGTAYSDKNKTLFMNIRTGEILHEIEGDVTSFARVDENTWLCSKLASDDGGTVYYLVTPGKIVDLNQVTDINYFSRIDTVTAENGYITYDHFGGGKCGVINNQGKIIYSTMYDYNHESMYIRDWRGDYGLFIKDYNNNQRFSIIDKSGATKYDVIGSISDSMRILSDNCAVFYKADKKATIINLKNLNEKTFEGDNITVDHITTIDDNDYFLIRSDDMTGDIIYESDNGRKISDLRFSGFLYDYLESKPTKLIFEMSNPDKEQHIFYDKNFAKLGICENLNYSRTRMAYLDNGALCFNNMGSIMDTDGNCLIKNDENNIWSGYNNNGPHKYISLNKLMDVIYDSSLDQYDSENKKYTYVDLDGKKNNHVYDDASPFFNGLGIVKRDDSLQVIDKYYYPLISVDIPDYINDHNYLRYSEGMYEATGTTLKYDDDYYIYDFSKVVDINSFNADSSVPYEEYRQSKYKNLLKTAYELDDFTIGGMDTKFTIPEDIPVIGGGEIGLDFSMIPIYAEKDGNTIRMAIGRETESSNGKKETTSLFNHKTWSDFKKGIDGSIEKGRKLYNATTFGVASSLSKKVKTSIYGYVEATINKKAIESVNGKVKIEIECSIDKKWQTVVVVVPVVISAKISAGVKTTLKVGLDYENSQLFIDGQMDFTLPKVKVSAGVGIAYICDVSVYGEFSNVISFTNSSDYQFRITDTISGEAGVSASALFFSYKKELWSGSKVVFDSGIKSRINNKTSFKPSSVKKISIPDNNDLKLTKDSMIITRKYSKTKNWLKETKTALTPDNITELQKDIYPQTEPKIVALDNGTKILAFLSDIEQRTTGNHTAVVYSIYDEKNKHWSDPVIVDDDGTADFYPSIASDGNNIYLTWTNASRNDFDDTTKIDEVARSCEIKVAKYNSSTGKFINITNLTNNNIADFYSVVNVINGIPYVGWIENSESDLIYLSGTNRLMYTTCSNNNWTSSKELVSSNTPIGNIAIGMLDNKAKLAYTKDTDGMMETSDDISGYVQTIGSNDNICFEEKSFISNLQFAKINNMDSMIYTSSDDLMIISNDTKTCLLENGNADGSYYSVVSGNNADLIICCKYVDDQYKLVGYILKDGAFDTEVSLTSQSDMLVKPYGVYNDNEYCLTFVRQNNDQYLSKDLCVMNFNKYTDIAIDSIAFDEETVKHNDSSKVRVTIDNTGMTNIEEYTVTIRNRNELLTSYTVTDALKTGEKKEIELLVPIPEDTYTDELFSCTVSAENDFNDSNNTQSFNMAKTNIMLETFQSGCGRNTSSEIYLTNTSDFDTNNAKVLIYKKNIDGELLKTINIGAIKRNELKQIKLSSPELNSIADENDSLFVVAKTDNDELYASDNVGFITLFNNKVLEIKLSNDSIRLGQIGQYKQLFASVYPSYASDQLVNYKSSDESIATVTDDGLVVARGEGKAIITAYSNDGSNAEEKCMVYVGSSYIDDDHHDNYNDDEEDDDYQYNPAKPTPNKNTTNTPTAAPSNNTSSTTSSISNSIIVPRVKITSIKNNKKRCVIIKWKRITGIKKYIIQYSTIKTFKKNTKKITVKKPNKTIKNLKKGKTYYFRIRAFSTVNGKTDYGKWSKVKIIKIKK